MGAYMCLYTYIFKLKNIYIYIVALNLDQVSVGQWYSLFQLPQNSNTPTMRLNTPRPWAQVHLLFKHRGAGHENDNCVGLKLAKKLALHCAGCMMGP